MKVLFYNWDRIDGNAGGGVTLYQRNLIQELLKNDCIDIYYLNSGLRYDNGGIRIEKISNILSPKIHCYEIVNSPVIAPVQQSPVNIQHYLTDVKVYDILKSFIFELGYIDIIHFNNIEGLPLAAFKLKEELSQTKFIYSLHNYFPICTRVNLWKDKLVGRGHNCDKINYSECDSCYFHLSYKAEIFKRMHSNCSGINEFVRMWSNDFPEHALGDVYKEFEEKTIFAINKYIDVVLAVSNRVRNIYIKHGLNKEKIKTSYIGTYVANDQLKKNVANPFQKYFHLVYMGYMRDSKGFYFFIDCMMALPKEISRYVVLTIAARYDDSNRKELEQIEQLRKNFADIILINGYNSQNQKDILQKQNLGIVPVLWEDNLPQVAIEQVAYGVPVLCSDLGGASELCCDSRFVFRANDQTDFLQKLIKIITNRGILNEYWDNTVDLMTMEQHIKELYSYYEING